jgi:CRISPR-associated protein (TIGR02584 family)
MSSTLICTLGQSAPVVTETLEALLAKKIPITKLIIIHTISPEVLSKKIKRKDGSELIIGLEKCIEVINKNHPNIEVVPIPLEHVDLFTTVEHNQMLNKTIEIIASEKELKNLVYVGIAGGRKTMSSSAHFAAYLMGCEGVYHVLLHDPENKRSENELFQDGFDLDQKYVTLVELPNVNLFPIFQSVLSDIAPSKTISDYLKEHDDLTDLFKRVSAELEVVVRQRKIREEYQTRFDAYSLMCQKVESILKSYAKESNLFKVEFSSRVKTLNSILEKMERKARDKSEVIENPFERFTDNAGCRVICYFDQDVEELRTKITSNKDFEVVEEEIPNKDSGYKAFHFIVKLQSKLTEDVAEYKSLRDVRCEIQVKTIFDHAWSQAEHGLRYKSPEYKSAEDSFKKTVDKVFVETNVFLENTREKFATLRKKFDERTGK